MNLKSIWKSISGMWINVVQQMEHIKIHRSKHSMGLSSAGIKRQQSFSDGQKLRTSYHFKGYVHELLEDFCQLINQFQYRQLIHFSKSIDHAKIKKNLKIWGGGGEQALKS